MALSKGANSFVTVEEAEAYFDDRLDAAAWNDATEANKPKALITATGMLLDELNWDPCEGIAVDMAVVPDQVIKATYELALHILTNSGVLDDTGHVHDLGISGISLGTIVSPSRIPSSVKKLVRSLLKNQGGRLWWRAN